MKSNTCGFSFLPNVYIVSVLCLNENVHGKENMSMFYTSSFYRLKKRDVRADDAAVLETHHISNGAIEKSQAAAARCPPVIFRLTFSLLGAMIF